MPCIKNQAPRTHNTGSVVKIHNKQIKDWLRRIIGFSASRLIIILFVKVESVQQYRWISGKNDDNCILFSIKPSKMGNLGLLNSVEGQSCSYIIEILTLRFFFPSFGDSNSLFVSWCHVFNALKRQMFINASL